MHPIRGSKGLAFVLRNLLPRGGMDDIAIGEVRATKDRTMLRGLRDTQRSHESESHIRWVEVGCTSIDRMSNINILGGGGEHSSHRIITQAIEYWTSTFGAPRSSLSMLTPRGLCLCRPLPVKQAAVEPRARGKKRPIHFEDIN